MNSSNEDGVREQIINALMKASPGMVRRALDEMSTVEDQDKEEFTREEIADVIYALPDSAMDSAWTSAYKAQAKRSEAVFQFDGTGVPNGINVEPYKQAIADFSYRERSKEKQETASEEAAEEIKELES